MSFLSKFFRRRQQFKSSDGFKVIVKTNNNLSEEQINAINTIVKDVFKSGDNLDSIPVLIIMNAGISDTVIVNRIKNGIKVII